MSVTFNSRVLVTPQEQIHKIEKSQEWKNSNAISNLAKKALFTIAQIYRAIPYCLTLLAYKIKGQSLIITKSSTIYKYVNIWNGLKELKENAPLMTWFSRGEEGGVFRRFANAMWYAGERDH